MPDFAETKELLIFHHLFSSLSLSEAAKKSGISVSNASKLLKSLRQKIGDPLFVRSGARMYPTEKARALYPSVRRVVSSLTEIRDNASDCLDPGTMSRHFRILTTDMVSAYLLASAAKILSRNCPGASLEIRPLSENYFDDLISWADLAIFTPTERLPSEFEALELYQTEDAVLLRKSHPLMKLADSPALFSKELEGYRKIDLLFEFRSHHEEFSPYDRYMDAGHQEAALSTPYLWGIPLALLESDYTVMLPDFAGKLMIRLHPGLAMVPLRQAGQPNALWSTKLIWHRRLTQDPAHTWFRSALSSEIVRCFSGEIAGLPGFSGS